MNAAPKLLDAPAPLIYQRIPAILVEIEAIGKNRKNDAQRYFFRGIDDIYNELHPLFSKHQVFTATEVLEREQTEHVSKSGSAQFRTILKVRFTFYTVDGSKIETVTIGEGMDSGDKSSNKAMAAAHKYALIQIFAIPTEGDKDSENDPPKVEVKRPGEAPKPAAAPAAQARAPVTSAAPSVPKTAASPAAPSIPERPKSPAEYTYRFSGDEYMKTFGELGAEAISDKLTNLERRFKSLAKVPKDYQPFVKEAKEYMAYVADEAMRAEGAFPHD